jgi:hypothetical protein
MAFTYNVDGYAAAGYFLAQEESFAAAPKAVSTSAGNVNSSLTLLSNASAINTIVGSIGLTQTLLSNAIVTCTVIGNINSTLPISVVASAFVPTQAAASIDLDMYISGQPTAQSSCLGGIDLRQTLISNAQVTSLLSGSIFSTLPMSSNSQATVAVSARLTFPSLYVGILDIISLTNHLTLVSLTPKYTITTLL